MMTKSSFWLVVVMLVPALAFGALRPAGQRQVISLDGDWDIAEGAMDKVPGSFGHKVQVPGLVDMAKPAFAEVGIASEKRQAFWYRTTFKLEQDAPAIAILKLNKAKFGTQVHLNGKLIGEDMHCFTPSYFDIKEHLRPAGEENELVVRIGAFHNVLPGTVQWGFDQEKSTYHPGIYDSVSLILSGAPYIRNVQIVPDVETQTVRVLADVQNLERAEEVKADYVIKEKVSGKVVSKGKTSINGCGKFNSVTLDFAAPIKDCRLWTPEEPFLYELELTTAGDGIKDTFGMRSFRFEGSSGRALLNGKQRYLRGSNVCIFRFFEDPDRAGRPWDHEWVRALHRKLKQMNWSSLRYSMGFPPEFWYDIADEEGILIQDEFPIWYGNGKKAPKRLNKECTATHIAEEYKEWMQERWNHPCVVIWDAQNETALDETGAALMMVRSLDVSNRPWDNGWGAPQHPDDCQETHPYLFSFYNRKNRAVPEAGPLSDVLTEDLFPRNGPDVRSGKRRRLSNAIIINEYAWLWLNRDGSTTRLADTVYQKAFPEADTVEKRRYENARWQAALTEYWRAHRRCAGVFHFSALGYSRSKQPRGQTSDSFLDVGKLTFDPMFEEYVSDAFAPVGLMINYWDSYVKVSVDQKVGVYVVNDLPDDWQGNVTFRVERNGQVLNKSTQSCKAVSCGRAILSFDLKIPAEKGKYKIIAELQGRDGKTVTSFRDVEMK